METDNGKNGTVERPSVAIVPTTATDEARGTIDAFASEGNFAAAQRIAKGLASSSLVPEAYRNNIPNVLIAMELSTRIGASVVAVMQNLDIIHGRPSWRASFLIATVNASGRFTPLRFRWEGKSGTPGWGCRAVAKDRESGEECIGALITMSLATAEGWTTKNGSKWKTMPEQMLMYRAASFWTRVYAPEKTLGMHTTEEIVDTFGPGERVIHEAEVVAATVSPQDVRAALEKAEAQSAPVTVPIESVTETAAVVNHSSNCPANIGENCECQ